MRASYTITHNPETRVSKTVLDDISDPAVVTDFMKRAGQLAYQFYVTEWLVPDRGESSYGDAGDPATWDINQQVNGDEWLLPDDRFPF
jgi:hypothetical protein